MKIIIKASFLFFLFFKSSFIFANTYDDCIGAFTLYSSALACSNGFICTLDTTHAAGSFYVHRTKDGVDYGYAPICIYTGDASCPVGRTRLTPSSYCTPNAVVCSSDKYNLNGTCTPIPDCNLGVSYGGNYFDHASKACAEGNHVICIGGSKTQYCPPNTDCQEPGTICANDPATVAAAQAEKAANLAAALERAKADVDRANKAAQDTSAPVATAEMQKTQANNNVPTSKAALDAAAANPNSTSAEKLAAAQAYADALNAALAASNHNDNTQLSAAQVLHDAELAASHKDAIPTAPTSGHGDAEADAAKQAADDAQSHLWDTVAGGGLGSGSTIGQGGGSGSGITPEGVAKGIRDGLTPSPGVSLNPGGLGSSSGSGHGTGVPTDTDGDGECDVDCGSDTNGDGQCDVDCGIRPGNFNQSIADAEDALLTSRDQLHDKMTEIRTGVSSIFGSSITNGNGLLPIVDFGTMKGVSVVLDMNKYADQLSIISAIIMALAWLAALSIILGGK